MAPVSYEEFEIGVPTYGFYTEIMNSERDIYSGCNMCNFKPLRTKRVKAHGLPQSISIDIAPYAGIVFITKNKAKAAPVKEPHTRKRVRTAG